MILRSQAQPSPPMVLDDPRNRSLLHGLRALGILLVIGFHVVFASMKLLADNEVHTSIDQFIAGFPRVFNLVWQALGSEVIFFLSGFLLTYYLLRELKLKGRIDLKVFLIKRASRILPLYFLALFAFAFSRRFDWDDYLANFFFVSKIFDTRTIVPVGWSLEVLVHFYLILPPLVIWLANRKHPMTIIGVLILASIAVRYIALIRDPISYQTPIYELIYGAKPTKTQEDLYHLTWFRLSPFLIGLWAAHALMEYPERVKRLFSSQRRTITIQVTALLGILISGFLPCHDRFSLLYQMDSRLWLYFGSFQRAIFIASITVLALCLLSGKRGLLGPFEKLLSLKFLAGISHNIYPIYLFHFVPMIPAAALVIWQVDRDAVTRIPTLDVAIVFIITAYLSVKLGQFLTRFVEHPAKDWIRKRWLKEESQSKRGSAADDLPRRKVVLAGTQAQSELKSQVDQTAS